MMVEKLNIFPQTLYQINCKGKFPSFLEESYKIKSKYKNTTPPPYTDLIYCSGISSNILNEIPSFFPLNSFIKKFVLDTYKKNIHIFNSWINFSYKHSFQEFHAHPADLVGVYYIKVPPKSGNLVIHSKTRSVEHITIKICSELMVICDGNQPHRVEQNFNDEPRIALPFNIKFI